MLAQHRALTWHLREPTPLRPMVPRGGLQCLPRQFPGMLIPHITTKALNVSSPHHCVCVRIIISSSWCSATRSAVSDDDASTWPERASGSSIRRWWTRASSSYGWWWTCMSNRRRWIVFWVCKCSLPRSAKGSRYQHRASASHLRRPLSCIEISSIKILCKQVN